MAKQSGFTFSILTIGAVALIVACSPNGGKVPITPDKPTAFQVAVNSCTDSLRASQKITFTGAHTVSLCEFPEKGGTIGTKLVPVPNDIRYSVTRGDDVKGKAAGRVNLAMTVELEASTALKDKEADSLKAEFTSDCLKDTQEIFHRSRFEGGTRVTLAFTVVNVIDDTVPLVGDAPADPTTPDLSLRISKTTDGADDVWVFNQLPTSPKYYPIGKASDRQACTDAGGAKDVQRKCMFDKRHALNIPACAAFARRVGNILGIVDTAKEQALCGAVPPTGQATAPATTTPASAGPTLIATAADLVPAPNTVAPDSKPAPSPSDDSTFAKPKSTDEDFMGNSTLNKKDLVKILSPACPSLRDVK